MNPVAMTYKEAVQLVAGQEKGPFYILTKSEENVFSSAVAVVIEEMFNRAPDDDRDNDISFAAEEFAAKYMLTHHNLAMTNLVERICNKVNNKVRGLRNTVLPDAHIRLVNLAIRAAHIHELSTLSDKVYLLAIKNWKAVEPTAWDKRREWAELTNALAGATLDRKSMFSSKMELAYQGLWLAAIRLHYSCNVARTFAVKESQRIGAALERVIFELASNARFKEDYFSNEFSAADKKVFSSIFEKHPAAFLSMLHRSNATVPEWAGIFDAINKNARTLFTTGTVTVADKTHTVTPDQLCGGYSALTEDQKFTIRYYLLEAWLNGTLTSDQHFTASVYLFAHVKDSRVVDSMNEFVSNTEWASPLSRYMLHLVDSKGKSDIANTCFVFNNTILSEVFADLHGADPASSVVSWFNTFYTVLCDRLELPTAEKVTSGFKSVYKISQFFPAIFVGNLDLLSATGNDCIGLAFKRYDASTVVALARHDRSNPSLWWEAPAPVGETADVSLHGTKWWEAPVGIDNLMAALITNSEKHLNEAGVSLRVMVKTWLHRMGISCVKSESLSAAKFNVTDTHPEYQTLRSKVAAVSPELLVAYHKLHGELPFIEHMPEHMGMYLAQLSKNPNLDTTGLDLEQEWHFIGDMITQFSLNTVFNVQHVEVLNSRIQLCNSGFVDEHTFSTLVRDLPETGWKQASSAVDVILNWTELTLASVQRFKMARSELRRIFVSSVKDDGEYIWDGRKSFMGETHRLTYFDTITVVKKFTERRKAKTNSIIPLINQKFQYKGKVYRVKVLHPGDWRALIIGILTGCCQHITGAASDSAEASYTDDSLGVVVVETESGHILAQSLLFHWDMRVDHETLCDNYDEDPSYYEWNKSDVAFNEKYGIVPMPAKLRKLLGEKGDAFKGMIAIDSMEHIYEFNDSVVPAILLGYEVFIELCQKEGFVVTLSDSCDHCEDLADRSNVTRYNDFTLTNLYDEPPYSDFDDGKFVTIKSSVSKRFID